MKTGMAREVHSPDGCSRPSVTTNISRMVMERKRSRDSTKVTHRPSMSSNGSSSLLEQIDLDVLEGIARRDSQPQHKVPHKSGVFFSRSNKNWLNPTFSSKVLEKTLKEKLHEYVRRRFRATLGILCIFCGIWLAFFSTQSASSTEFTVDYHLRYIIGGAILCAIILVYMAVTWVVYKASTWLFFSFLVLLAAFSWLITITTQFDHDSPIFGSVSFVVQFTMSSMLLIFIHVLSLKSLVFKLTASVIYIVVLEVLSVFFSYGKNELEFHTETVVYATVTHSLLLLCVNMAAANAAYFLQIRHHDTFWKITQCLFYKEAHYLERILKEKTIHSLIPNHIANSLMSDEVQSLINIEGGGSHVLFPLYQLENVSILFADIVGFTSLSAAMPAASVVTILNDIFSKFDHLSEVHSCEKISTLGDCYFCVSGCPQADPNHASNIVDMGLDIVAELKRYKQEKDFDIDMRVGIHTGTVLSGVIGTKRFKYDVWSKDVTLAGQVERCGIPGNVVITEATHRHISSNYVCERIELQNFSSLITTYCVVEKRSHNTGASVKTWKHRIRNIDVTVPLSSPERNADAASYTTSNSSSNVHPVQRLLQYLPCVPQKSSTGGGDMYRAVSENSIIEIFNRQSELEKCQLMGDSSEEYMQMVDKKIVEMMEKNNVELETFFETSLHSITLSYQNTEMEIRYRSLGKGMRRQNPKETECSFRVSKTSFFVDVTLSFLVFILCASSVALTGGHTVDEKLLLGIVVFCGVLIEIPVFILALAVFQPKLFPKVVAKKSEFILGWYGRTIIALFFIYYPMVLAYLNLAVCHSDGFISEENVINIRVSFYVIIVSLATSINFMEVSYLAKLLAGLITVTAALFIAYLRQFSKCSGMSDGDLSTESVNITSGDIEKYFERHVLPETIILLFLLMFLLIQVNRMSETTVRRQFNGLMEAWLGKKETRIHTDQANRLLSNILPKHVNKELRKTGKFSKNHECVGVLFASIENLHDFRMQDITNQGEEEYACKIRLLSEIVSHFDHLLNRKEFSGIEKIKTIGCTYMAASGLLEVDERRPTVAHLVNLVNFALQLLDLISWVNSKLNGHMLHLKVGLNYGPVTSGVVGTSKLLYDIWGDTVNVASRMESTGVTGRIHLPASCVPLLERYFEFERHGQISVKGKGVMDTVFVIGRRRQFINFATIPEDSDIVEAEVCEAEMCEANL